jgi:hypothetical protein
MMIGPEPITITFLISGSRGMGSDGLSWADCEVSRRLVGRLTSGTIPG